MGAPPPIVAAPMLTDLVGFRLPISGLTVEDAECTECGRMVILSDSGHVGAQSAELLLEPGIAPVQVIDPGDLSLAFSGQAGQDQ